MFGGLGAALASSQNRTTHASSRLHLRPRDAHRMTLETGTPQGDSVSIDWQHARGFLLSAVRHRLKDVPPQTHEDLAHDALVRLLRACRSQTIINLEAFMNTIASAVVTDFLRSRRRWQLLLAPFDESAARVPAGATDPLSRLEFLVLEFFAERNADCAVLAREYFAEVPWSDVSKSLDEPPPRIRKRWSNCLALLRDAAKGDASPLLEWCDD